MLTDLVQIRLLGDKKKPENQRFRKYLKVHNFDERKFRQTAEEIQDQIDCRQCANCCRVTEVQIVERDVQSLMKLLGTSERTFMEKYTALGEDGELILRRDPKGCVFLDGNDCTVYESRPGNCERFPHLMRGAGSLLSRMWQFVDRATYCPIVYNWMEKAKTLTKFR